MGEKEKEKKKKTHENNVFSRFQMHFTTNAAWPDESIVRDGSDFLVATFVDDEVDVPTRGSGDLRKESSIQLRNRDYREWRFVQDEAD